MQKYFILLVAMILSVSAVAFAYERAFDYDNDNADKPKKFGLKYLKQIDDHVFDLGEVEVKGEKIQGYAFVNKRNSYLHTSGTTAASTCYSFFATGAKWKIKENWIVNPANSEGLASSFILSNMAADIQKWETAAGKDAFGTGSLTSQQLVADSVSPDGKNEVYFADVTDANAIAVTIVWGIFSGPTYNRKIIEWDQVYDDVDFSWSSTGAAGKMDFENIATHELGHAFGMGHPGSACTQETMYYSAAYGETKKRSLNAGDKAGVKKLYA
ncbi:MAG TPA: matrixin family metalloprotease [archaeon]|nr:matrixin family metalloprotease [archaeon]